MAYRAFVRPVAEYGSVLMMGASATQLSKFDRMQHLAEQLCSTQFIPPEKRRHAAAIGLLCKLLDGTCREYLQRFCPSFQSSISLPRRSQRLNPLQPFVLTNFITTTSLDLFRRSFLGCATEIWNTTKLDDIRSNVCQIGLNLQVVCNILFVMYIVTMTELLLYGCVIIVKKYACTYSLAIAIPFPS